MRTCELEEDLLKGTGHAENGLVVQREGDGCGMSLARV